MPILSGPELATIVAAERPGIRIVLMTGYTSGSVPADMVEGLLRKPFLPRDLIERIRRELASLK